MAKQQQGRYEARVGLTYTPAGAAAEVRREPGDRCDDVPPVSLPWLIADGLIIDHAPARAQEDGASG